MTFTPDTHQKQGLAYLKAGQTRTPETMARDVRALMDYVHFAYEHGAYPFAGIDPGTQGAAAVVCVSKRNVHRHHLRFALGFEGLTHEEIFWTARAVCELVRDLGGRVALELVGPRPHDGARAAFTFGENKAWLDAAAVTSGVRHEHVAPQKWMRDLGLIGKGTDGKKKLLISRAEQLWPGWKFTIGGKRSVADAALIASWCAARWHAMVLPDDDLGW
ncbi:MAG: hypothetical protein CL489_06940 [Acidobacteria bacterium]|nr:hypothetical protein [Acidobacteriota bacterium]|tara:strand:+ start:354 stop:1007 length:654 start_codon:yes stop_codon:yes gene_type:complete